MYLFILALGYRDFNGRIKAQNQPKVSLNSDNISRNMLLVMRIVQKVSHIMFAHKICLQVSGTKYPVISTSYQVSQTSNTNLFTSVS